MLGFKHLEMVDCHDVDVLLNKSHRREKSKDVEGVYKGVMVKVTHRI